MEDIVDVLFFLIKWKFPVCVFLFCIKLFLDNKKMLKFCDILYFIY